MSEWADESASEGRVPLQLDEKGVRWSDGDVSVQATWRQVFGVAVARDRAYILMPRRPPEPPWVPVTMRQLPEGIADLEALADRVRARVAQSGYRDGGPRRPLLPPDVLMERVLARHEVPGALEVPVGVGPGGIWRRGIDLMAAGSAGGLAGLYLGTMVASGPVIAVAVAAGALFGAATPVATSANWRSVRNPRSKPRVLVLAPDGCVVGLPTGPTAYAWPDVDSFRESTSTQTNGRNCLEITTATGVVTGRIDAAWFGAPLPLIVAVAEAYRKRHTAA